MAGLVAIPWFFLRVVVLVCRRMWLLLFFLCVVVVVVSLLMAFSVRGAPPHHPCRCFLPTPIVCTHLQSVSVRHVWYARSISMYRCLIVAVSSARQEIAHDLASALYRLLSKKDPVLKAGAFRVAEAVLAPENSAPRDPQSPAASTVAVVPASERRRDYRGVFARHGVTKLVSLFGYGMVPALVGVFL